MKDRLPWPFWLTLAVLVALRLPSVAQPPGADQGLYAYVGQRLLAGEVPYRDAWDQKPPAIHVAYALMQAAWPDLRVVAATDLVLAVATALLLVALGRAFRVRGGGETAALLFLALGNPVFGRLGGVRVRAQCEVFIACAVTLALVLAWRAARAQPRGGTVAAFGAGMLVGVAVTFKYNAAVYVLPVIAMLCLGGARMACSSRQVAWLAAGGAVPLAAVIAWLASAGALTDLYHATYTYNLLYSGETYRDLRHALTYLVTFPVAHARVDSLWWMGGLACVGLLVTAVRAPRHAVILLWVAAACLAIAINGSRGLPQYFVQAWPALALAAGIGLAAVWQRLSWVPRVLLAALLVLGVWRVTPVPKAADYVLHDLQYLTGHLSRERYLARFGERASGEKYSALAIDELARYLRARTGKDDPVLLFGFSPGALAQSHRRSASRFFWSRPVIVGFNEHLPGHGVRGLLEELAARPPVLVILQRRDWDPDGPDSWTFFTTRPELDAWLQAHYEFETDLGNFAIWRRARS